MIKDDIRPYDQSLLKDPYEDIGIDIEPPRS